MPDITRRSLLGFFAGAIAAFLAPFRPAKPAVPMIDRAPCWVANTRRRVVFTDKAVRLLCGEDVAKASGYGKVVIPRYQDPAVRVRTEDVIWEERS